MGWASIDNGDPGDEVWLDRSYDGGRTWEPKLGDTFTPDGARGWRTLMHVFRDDARGLARLRACGKAGDRDEIACTKWLPACIGYFCDGADPALAVDEQNNPAERMYRPLSRVFERQIQLHIWCYRPSWLMA